MLPARAEVPFVDPCIVIRAISVTPNIDLDLNLWNSSLELRERAGLGV
jgi:hypothetical protein